MTQTLRFLMMQTPATVLASTRRMEMSQIQNTATKIAKTMAIGARKGAGAIGAQKAREASTENVEGTTAKVEGMRLTQTLSRYDQLILEGKQRAEEAYIAELTASGTPLYAANEVASRFGIPVDPTWVQKDLQRLMAVGDIFYPIAGLRAKATDIHELYVVPGRSGMRAILQDVYSFYLQARASEHCDRIVNELNSNFVATKLRATTTVAGTFIRSVFANYDDKQVHVYGKALEYCYFKNIAAGEFDNFVRANGGFEGVRKLAMEELPKTAKQLEEAEERKELKEWRAEQLAQWWSEERKNQRGKFPLPPGASASEFPDGKELALRAVVKNGEVCIYWNVPMSKVVMSALDEVMVDRLGHDAKNDGVANGDVYRYIQRQLDWINNPSPTELDHRERVANRAAAANM